MPTYNTPTTVAEFRANYLAVAERIAAAADRADRHPEDVRLITVSKTFPVSQALLAVSAGMTVLGENRPQELAEKATEFQNRGITDVTWCAIGHLQRNKAKEIAQFASEFHALDSLRLAEALQHRLELADRTLDVFIQVNTSHEEQKGGFAPEAVAEFLPQVAQLDRLRVRGLMTMAAFSPEEKIVRPSFVQLRKLRDELAPTAPAGVQLQELSMGMSGDFEWAIAEGATSVRVGTAIFGHRPNSAYL
ncbi:MAG: YggS family pyridoxal phosphate-dependent enzyme [Corynebacterium sp.]|nr:YggS family pyridoxal phosphate-dependent enzyme [Corynebacterium sp.]